MIELNCLDMRCPLPIIELAKELRKLSVGETVRLSSNDPATEPDLQAWARMTGNEVQILGTDQFLVTKTKMN
jgi:tRNA 2-thiouridine synthesizing protein A